MIRRAAVLMMELNRTPNNMIHMTNVGAAPLLSYAQQNLDWEDNLGVNVFQKRYTPEYIRTISTGRQLFYRLFKKSFQKMKVKLKRHSLE